MKFNVPKYLRLKQQLADSGAALRDRSAERTARGDVRRQLEANVNRHRAMSSEPVPQGMLDEIDHARQQEAVALRRYEELSAQVRPLKLLVARLSEFLTIQGVKVDDQSILEDEPVASGTPMPTPAEIEAQRRVIEAIRGEARDVVGWPCSEAESDQKIEASTVALVDELRTTLGPFATQFVAAGRAVPPLELFHETGVISDDANRRLTLALFAATSPEPFRALLRTSAAAAAEQRGGWGPGADERAEIIAGIAHRLFEAEVDEEALISTLERVGATFARRADADPRAVLYVPPPAGKERAEAPSAVNSRQRSRPPRRATPAPANTRVGRSAYIYGESVESSTPTRI